MGMGQAGIWRSQHFSMAADVSRGVTARYGVFGYKEAILMLFANNGLFL